MDLATIAQQLDDCHAVTDGYRGRCPVHGGTKDVCHLWEENGKIRVHCFASCDNSEVRAALGMSTSIRNGPPMGASRPVEKKSTEQIADEMYADMAERTPLAQILTPKLTPEQMARMLKLKAPEAHEWATEEIAERLLEFGEPGNGQYRIVLNEFFNRSRYSTETRQQIKHMVGQKAMVSDGTIASRSRSLAEYRKNPPEPKIYQDPKAMARSGVTVLAGRPKMGKSYLALNLGLAMASKGKFISGFDITYPGDVLYLALEDDESRMWSRIQALLGNDTEPDNFFLDFSAPTLTDGKLIEEIKEWIARDDVKEPRLIVIDVYRIVQSARGKKDLYEAEYNDMIQLNRLAKDHDLHIVIVTHLNKAYSTVEDYADSIMSSTAISGGASAIWILANKGEEGVDADLHISGKDVPKWTCGLKRIDLEGHIDWQVLGDTNTLIKGRVQADILTTLFQWPGVRPTATELRDVIDTRMDRSNFHRTLRKLMEDGLVAKEKNRYVVTQQGASSAEIIIQSNAQSFDTSDNIDNSDNSDNSDNRSRRDVDKQIDSNASWENYVDNDF